ncbi:Retrovirus-related Pol polyprotein from transposon TNT 1-94, partial [Linum perenne]
GFTQKPGLDYFDTYSPVTKISTIRILFALASINHMHVHQMDVKTAFLNGELNEEIYMEVPPGSSECIVGQKVCRLRKSLYGLKQAPKQCNLEAISETKTFLSSHFEMKDMGEVDVILGVKVIKLGNTFALSQQHYVNKLLVKFNCENEDHVRTPYDSSFHLTKFTGEAVNQTEYAKTIGSLMFLTNCTRPDVAFAVNRLSRYTSNPSSDHWIALRRVLKYLKGTANWGLKFKGYPPILEGYTDANWVTSKDDVSSTSGFVFTLGGAAVSWKSTKQTCIAR